MAKEQRPQNTLRLDVFEPKKAGEIPVDDKQLGAAVSKAASMIGQAQRDAAGDEEHVPVRAVWAERVIYSGTVPKSRVAAVVAKFKQITAELAESAENK